jgi:hypothetical protein
VFISWILWLIFQSQWTLDKFAYNQERQVISATKLTESVMTQRLVMTSLTQICTLPSFHVLSPTLNCHILYSIDQNTNHRICRPKFEFTNVSSICSYVNQAADIDRGYLIF